MHTSLDSEIGLKDIEELLMGDDEYWSTFEGLSFLEFNKRIGLPRKNGLKHPIYDYEWEVLDALSAHKHVWIKKATGLGITELLLRWIGWLCTRDGSYRGKKICIVTGPRIELSITLIARVKRLFHDRQFESKETVAEINGCSVEAFPSHHLDAMRGLTDVTIILLDEADFFPPGEQKDARDVSERYIAKSNPHIIMVSTPNLPGGLYEQIEKEKQCLYHRLALDYTKGLGKIYSDEEIEQAKRSPSFEREYDLKYGYGVGNIFPYQLVDACTGNYDLALKEGQKILAVDPGYGSSKFAIVGIEQLDGILYVKEGRQYERPSPSAMLEEVLKIAQGYGRMVLVDSAHPGLISDLSDRGIDSQPVNFQKELSTMTFVAVQAVKEQKVKIHTAFSDLTYQLRAVEFDAKGHPNKKKLTFDLGDAFMMALSHFGHGDLYIASI